MLNFRADGPVSILGAIWQGRAGTGRHDAVAWGYARAADRLGVDIIQNCEVTGFTMEGGVCKGVETSHGSIRAGCIGVAVAGHSSHMAKLGGYALPIESYALQAFVSEPLKPMLDTVVFSAAHGGYISQSNKGDLVMGGALDRVPSYGNAETCLCRKTFWVG